MNHPAEWEKAKLIIKQYQQLNESLITNPEFLEGRIAKALIKQRDETLEEASEISKIYMQKVYDMGDVKVGTKWCVHLLSSLTNKIRQLKSK